MYEWHGFGGGMMWIFPVIILVALVVLIGLATQRSKGSSNHEKSALELLKNRYARGEIICEEFEQIKNDLKD